MDDRFNQLSGMIVQKNLEHCSVNELQDLAERYPFFAPLHFLLLRKKELEGLDISADLQRSMLYYHDPVSFAHFMQPRKTDDRFLYETAPSPVPEVQAAPEEQAVTMNALDQPQEEEIPTLQIKPEPLKETANEQSLTFEPFHTVDYFASQGIKPSKEEPKDAFGKQLKSFTEWLRTMKKLPDPVLSASRAVDPVVDVMANRSVTDSEVVTEAMAEVWIKQGNRQKAIEIYRKLSLSDPSKTPYFAAKIDNLNAE